MAWARARARSDEHLLALVLALRCFQRLGCFPRPAEVPATVVEHIRRGLRLPEGTAAFCGAETGKWQRRLVRERLGVVHDPQRARTVTEAAVRSAAEVMMPLSLIPPGQRPYYCLAAGAVSRLPLAPGIDFCAAAPLLHSTIDTGTTSAFPLAVPGQSRQFGVGVAMPIYRTGVTPTTIAARRASFVGWIGLGVAAQVLLEQALQGHPAMRVVPYRGSAAALSFAAGRSAAHPDRPARRVDRPSARRGPKHGDLRQRRRHAAGAPRDRLRRPARSAASCAGNEPFAGAVAGR